ncbi:MAG: DMT family transporter [Hespellia sp.]|nr:DMT family transporter [Hespellia sp.]
MSKMKTNGMLILTAFIWGMAFVAQKVGMDYVGPLTFNALRSFIGAVVLLPVIVLLDRQRDHFGVKKPVWNDKTLILGGICSGIFLCIGSTLQQYALMESSVGKVGFITALYILIVPILGVFLKKQIPSNVWIAVFVAIIGMYFLCMTEGFSINHGDLLAMLCAFAFAAQIMVVDYFSPKVDSVRMSSIQFLVVGIIAGTGALFRETIHITEVMNAYRPLLYAGVLSCGVAYTLQIVAQKHAQPTIASLLMSLESVFSVLGGWILLGQVLSPRELFGCTLVFTGVLLAQIPIPKLTKKKRE